MKVFLSSDLEGTAGVVDWEQCVGDGPQAAAGRALLLDEVNAAIEGAVDGGATEIVLNDSHSTMRNMPPGSARTRTPARNACSAKVAASTDRPCSESSTRFVDGVRVVKAKLGSSASNVTSSCACA